MIGRLSSSRFAAFSLAALLAASGVFSARAEDPVFSIRTTLLEDYRILRLKPLQAEEFGADRMVISVTDPAVGVRSEEDLSPTRTAIDFEDLTAGQTVAVDGYLVQDVATNAETHALQVMGSTHDGDAWLHETVGTYVAKEGESDDNWSGRDLAQVLDGRIVIDTQSELHADWCLSCTAGDLPDIPLTSRGFTLSNSVAFAEISDDPPDPEERPLGLTVACLDEDNPNLATFAYVEHGDWQAVPVSVCDPSVSTNWQVFISVDLLTYQATYFVRAAATNAWTLLGTASDVHASSVTKVTFYGKGALDALEGHGFDTQLLQVDVEFGDNNLRPGCNFEETIITGRVTMSTLHKTSVERSTGTYLVQLVDINGNDVVTPKEFTYDAERGVMEFYVKATDLNPGSAYVAKVSFVDPGVGEMNEVDATRTAVMGRSLTNDFWSVDGSWFYEDVDTFNGEAVGSGVWKTNDASFVYAWTTNDWIEVKTVSDEYDMPVDAAVLFTPTNELDETASYTVRFRARFPEDTVDPESEDAVFGCTVAKTDDGLQFMCLSNRVWCAVPLETFAPELDVEYRFTVFAQIKDTHDKFLVCYFLDVDDGVVQLMSVDLDADLARRFEYMDVRGHGAIADLAGSAYSTELLRLNVDFANDALYPGTNFEASAANGVIHFEQLWDTDHTNGQLRVVIRDKWGLVIGYRRISFHDLSDRGFDYYIEGLEAGEYYTVSVEAEVNGITEATSDDFREGTMARVVTNELWGTADEWIRENAATFEKTEPGTGTWDDGGGLAVSTNGVISINTTLSDDASAIVGFTATNALPPEHTGFEIRSNLRFDMPCSVLPTLEGSYGLTIVPDDPDASNPNYLFAIVSNGVWTVLGSDVYDADLGVEYELVVNVDGARDLVTYSIGEDGEVPTVIAEFEIDERYEEVPYEAVWRGIGQVRTYEGDGLDTALVRISADFNDSVQQPGTNFAATVAAGRLHIRQFWMTDQDSGEYTIYVRDARGNLVFERTLTYHDLVDQDFSVDVTNLVAGGVYDVSLEATLAGKDVGSDSVVTKMARLVGTWIDEDAETFLDERPGTGLWSGTNETAYVVDDEAGRAIQIATIEDALPVVFSPTNDSLSVRCSTLREIRMDLTFTSVGWYSTELAPSVSSNALAAVTAWCDDSSDETTDDDYAVAVLSNGTWQVMEATRGHCSVSEPCEVTMLIDYKNGLVRYDVSTPSYTNRVCQYDFEPEHRTNTIVKFVGGGLVRSIDGDTWDPNLIASATNEFETLNEAILGSNEDEILSPLWWADQCVTVGKGTFRIYDTNNWLHVTFPNWYYYVITREGDVKVYRFNQSNNWIDYAADGDANVEILDEGALFLVHTPEGLSWIAAQATNEWISGRIELDGDIDLSAHNWTPIAGFSGTFDGKGNTIKGLNNLYCNAGIPGGEYVYGPTNLWGRSTYGLFGTATNATLTGVTFANVAISNYADSVAALVGALAGNCAVSNVTVESGSVFGFGGTAAGLAGFADFEDFLTVIGNTNRAVVAAESDDYGEGRWTAGLLCVAGPTDPEATNGTVVVTNNANYGVISSVIYDADLFGGNVAQILAGTTLGAHFGEVHLTNNLAAGEVDVDPIRTEGNHLAVTNYPAVNLAPCFWGYDENGTFLTSIDANRHGVIAVDPCYRTARMLSGTYPNGTENEIGLVNDEITSLLPGSVMKLRTNLESWGPIVLDRDITFDMDGHEIYTVYINNTFIISNGVHATVQNGTISINLTEGHPFVGDTSNLTTNNLTIQEIPWDFYERTAQINVITPENPEGEPVSLFYTTYLTEVLNSSKTVIELFSDSEVVIDADAGTLSVNGIVLARLSDCYGFRVVQGEDGATTKFVVNIADSAAPTVEFSMTGGEAGKVSVKVGNAKTGFYYALQHKTSLAEEWTDPSADDWILATSENVTLEADTNGSQGYYRVQMTDVDPNYNGEGGDSGGGSGGGTGGDSGDEEMIDDDEETIDDEELIEDEEPIEDEELIDDDEDVLIDDDDELIEDEG